MKRSVTDRSNALVLAERTRREYYVDQLLTTVLNETGGVPSSCAFRQSGLITFSDVAAPYPQVARFTRASEVDPMFRGCEKRGWAQPREASSSGSECARGPGVLRMIRCAIHCTISSDQRILQDAAGPENRHLV